jgi:hypothetical protein
VAINTQKVVVGGIAAAVVNNVLGFVIFGMLLAPSMNAEMDAVLPGASAKMMGGNGMIWAIGGSVVMGFVMAWTYAAMRPRFGPGMKTAVMASLPTWFAGLFFWAQNMMGLGMISMKNMVLGSIAAFVINLAMAATAGFLYKEDGA